MVDVISSAYSIIFISILLVVGVVVFATVADPMGDQYHSNEIVIAALCSNTSGASTCTGSTTYTPIENVTRALPVVRNCSVAGGSGGTCQTLTASTDYNLTLAGVLFVFDDTHNGTIMMDYWEDDWSDATDRAQQSITGTAYGGFDLAVVMLIVIAAVAIIGTVFLFGKRGA